MIILGIETSCDETAASLLREKALILGFYLMLFRHKLKSIKNITAWCGDCGAGAYFEYYAGD